MKRNNKKGFTIVELVIVIAVIGILAAVLIPTFTGIVDDAKESAALQEARNTWTQIMADNTDSIDEDYVIVSDGLVFTVFDGEIERVEGTVDSTNLTLTIGTETYTLTAVTGYNTGKVTAVYTAVKNPTA